MSRSQQLIPAAMEPASDWYKPSHGWPSIMLSACLGGACTWLALAAWGGVEPHAGWRQSMRAVASARDSCAPQPWPASLRCVCVCSQGLILRVFLQISCLRSTLPHQAMLPRGQHTPGCTSNVRPNLRLDRACGGCTGLDNAAASHRPTASRQGLAQPSRAGMRCCFVGSCACLESLNTVCRL